MRRDCGVFFPDFAKREIRNCSPKNMAYDQLRWLPHGKLI